MQISSRTKYMALALGAVVIFSQTDSAQAQTVNMTVGAEVLNTLTISEVASLHFGDIIAVSSATHNATATVNTAGTLAVGTSGATATAGIVDNALASAAQLTVEDGGDGATVNITIDNVTNPTLGPSTFTTSVWNFNYNSGATIVNPATPGTSDPVTFSTAFGGGVNTLNIGATITAAGATVFADGTYSGDFDVIFSY